MTTEPRESLNSVQFMRFLAAFLVLITHCGFYVHERLDPGFTYWKRGSAGVALFFVISGFVMIISSEGLRPLVDGWKTFASRRLARIVPIYWIATSVKVLALVYAAQHVLHAEFDLAFIVRSYFFIPSYNPIDGTIQPLLGVGWTLVYEMFFYLLFTLALFLNIRPILFVGSILLVLCLGSLFRDSLLQPQTWPLTYFLLSSTQATFIFGMVLGEIYLRGFLLSPMVSVVAIAIGMSQIVLDVFGVLAVIPPIISIGVGSVLVVWGGISLERAGRLKIPRLFVFLGAASYSTYLFHPLLAPIVPVAFKRLGMMNAEIATVVAIVFALASTSLVYVLLERPISNFLSARRRRLGKSSVEATGIR